MQCVWGDQPIDISETLQRGLAGERSARGRRDVRMFEFVFFMLSANQHPTGVSSIAELRIMSASLSRSVGVRTAYNDLSLNYVVTRLTELTIFRAVR